MIQQDHRKFAFTGKSMNIPQHDAGRPLCPSIPCAKTPEQLMERVISVDTLDGHKLNILFNNGVRKVFDVSPYLSKGLFSRLRDPELFKQAYVAYDTMCWPGNLDIAPATLFDRGQALQPELTTNP
jgi:hypothetical protein